MDSQLYSGEMKEVARRGNEIKSLMSFHRFFPEYPATRAFQNSRQFHIHNLQQSEVSDISFVYRYYYMFLHVIIHCQ